MRMEGIESYLDYYMKPPDDEGPLTIPSPLREALLSSPAEHTPEWSARLARLFVQPLIAMLSEIGRASPPSSLLGPLAGIATAARTAPQIKAVHKRLIDIALQIAADPHEKFAILVVAKVCLMWESVHGITDGLPKSPRDLCVPEVGGFVGGVIRLHQNHVEKDANIRAIDQLAAAVAKVGDVPPESI